jgi:hypothetical protein
MPGSRKVGPRPRTRSWQLVGWFLDASRGRHLTRVPPRRCALRPCQKRSVINAVWITPSLLAKSLMPREKRDSHAVKSSGLGGRRRAETRRASAQVTPEMDASRLQRDRMAAR